MDKKLQKRLIKVARDLENLYDSNDNKLDDALKRLGEVYHILRAIKKSTSNDKEVSNYMQKAIDYIDKASSYIIRYKKTY